MPTVLLLEDTAPPTTSVLVDVASLPADRLRQASDGWYAVVPLGGATHRLWFHAKPVKPVPYDVKLSLDADFESRKLAADRLWRALNNRPLGPAFDGLTRAQRARLGLALRALDGHQEGASYRTIATVLFGADRIPKRGWKSSDVRSRIIRLVDVGKQMMLGGYRELLRPRRKKR